jgi:hypothetical protein
VSSEESKCRSCLAHSNGSTVRLYPTLSTIDAYKQTSLADDVRAFRCINVISYDFQGVYYPKERDRLALVPVPLGLRCFCLESQFQLSSSAGRE